MRLRQGRDTRIPHNHHIAVAKDDGGVSFEICSSISQEFGACLDMQGFTRWI